VNGEFLMNDKIERNWLIRTRSMQILGPVSLEKVLELIEKKSLRDEDEVTSGNGYWFCIREDELVERYLKQKQGQGFNPITEAPNVLTKHEDTAPVAAKSERRKVEEEIIAPAEEDLEYPDMAMSLDDLPNEEVSEESLPPLGLEQEDEEDEEREDITMVASGLQLPVKEKPKPPAPIEPEPQPEPEEEPEPEPVTSKPAAPVEGTEEIPVVLTKKVQKKSKAAAKKSAKNDRYLFVLLALVFCLIIGVVYYYRTILNRPLPGFETSWLINSAHAQNALLTTATKKKML
tara:strand:- start:6722 stop:7588 length:867 start_codon:yes stop_codon:yes gene_type:complete